MMIDKLKEWLMLKYCPKYESKRPMDYDLKEYDAEVILIWGYWGHKSAVIDCKRVVGLQKAYTTVRWMALKADWKNPEWLFTCGIDYRLREVKDE
jgi:hypothetical protein